MELNSTKGNMITKTKLFESNLQMGREIYFMRAYEEINLDSDMSMHSI